RYEKNQYGGFSWGTGLETNFRPFQGWEIEIEPSFNKELNPAQYVETADDPDYKDTFGHRYIFGELMHQTLSLETRLNVAFNSKLTIQFYAQTFISSGKYLNYKQLKNPRSYKFDIFNEGSTIVDGDDNLKYLDFNGDQKYDFSFEDGNFTIRSLKLNGVLRWEYLPGSTLFLVWQHSRFNEKNNVFFDINNSLNRLWSTRPDNAVILKLNYWLEI
ncbi:MAG: hypothetical protein KDF60_19645, partial [Calditrichaeota bacterium]|nr:hypothetical protein [Calditrichota bacterium]